MDTSPNSSWFYAEGTERKGPVPFHQLQQIIAAGLPSTSLVWTEGMATWQAAQEIPGLIESSITAPSQSDPDNPYASPASIEPRDDMFVNQIALPEPPASPISLDIGFCIRQAWKYTCANLGSLFLLGLVIWIISVAISAVLSGVALAVEGPQVPTKIGPNGIITISPTTPMALITGVLNQIVSIFFGLGATRYAHRLLSGDSPEIGDAFSQGSKLWTAILATILYAIIVVIGLIFFIIPGIYLALRFGFYQQAIVEKNLGVIDSLKYSSQLTRENKLNLVGLYILSFFIVIAGLLALIIGLLWAIPTAWLAPMIAYRYLHTGPASIKQLP